MYYCHEKKRSHFAGYQYLLATPLPMPRQCGNRTAPLCSFDVDVACLVKTGHGSTQHMGWIICSFILTGNHTHWRIWIGWSQQQDLVNYMYIYIIIYQIISALSASSSCLRLCACPLHTFYSCTVDSCNRQRACKELPLELEAGTSFLLTKLVMQLKRYLKQPSPRNHPQWLWGMHLFENLRLGFGWLMLTINLSTIQRWAVSTTNKRLAVSPGATQRGPENHQTYAMFSGTNALRSGEVTGCPILRNVHVVQTMGIRRKLWSCSTELEVHWLNFEWCTL